MGTVPYHGTHQGQQGGIMNLEMKALGRRAVACAGWRWLPGMRVSSGGKARSELMRGMPTRLLVGLRCLGGRRGVSDVWATDGG